MNTRKRIAMTIGGVVVLALLLAVTMPKTTHAVVSTLVTVANTYANPIPVDSDGIAAKQIILVAQTVSTGLVNFSNIGSPGTPYLPPANTRFVVDEINIAGSEATDGALPEIDILLYSGSNYYYPIIPPLSLLNGGPVFSSVTPVHAFSDSGNFIAINVVSKTGVNFVNVNLIGHLIDCSSGCAVQ